MNDFLLGLFSFLITFRLVWFGERNLTSYSSRDEKEFEGRMSTAALAILIFSLARCLILALYSMF